MSCKVFEYQVYEAVLGKGIDLFSLRIWPLKPQPVSCNPPSYLEVMESTIKLIPLLIMSTEWSSSGHASSKQDDIPTDKCSEGQGVLNPKP